MPDKKSKLSFTFEQFKLLTDGAFRKILTMVILWYVLSFLFEIGTKAFDNGKMDILLMILTALLNMSAILLGFYYASTQSSQDKDKKLDKLISHGDEER
jgi:hypothetical protein